MKKFNNVLILFIILLIISFALSCGEKNNQTTNVNSNNAKEYYERALEFSDLGKYKQAIEQYTKAIQTDSKYTKAYFNRGALYFNNNEFENSISDFSKVLELSPNDAEAYYNRGQARYYNAQKSLACTDWKEAKRLGFIKAQNMLDVYCR
jgi:tetratricopeptide (TPR) repeat protein